MRTPVERIIFDNYYSKQRFDECYTLLAEEYSTDPSDEEVFEFMWEENDMDWTILKEELEQFFEGKEVLFFGTVGRWNGTLEGGRAGEFMPLLYSLTEDCNDLKISDKNGHLYIKCSHHDGTNYMEVKVLNERGKNFLYNWEHDWTNKTPASVIYEKLVKNYSTLPRFCEKVWGCKRVQYEN